MRASDGRPPPLPENWVMPLRVVAVIIGYGVYRWMEPEYGVPAAAFVGLGLIAFLEAMVDRYGVRRHERSGLMQVGQTILGLGLIGIGAYIALR